MNKECYICLLTKPKEEFNLRATRCKECECLFQPPTTVKRKASNVAFAYNMYKKQAAQHVEKLSGGYKLIAHTKKFMTFANQTSRFTIPTKVFERISVTKYEFVFRKTKYKVVRKANLWIVE